METESYKIKQGQYLSDIWEFLPENAIIAKTLPGLGATSLEITSKRNSIIIEPNVPVIEGKMKKFPDILGVKESVTTKNVVDYLSSSVEYKKIIVTPESYFKVQNAFKQLRINYFEEYFLLFDECERITQDIDYRESIDAPMVDFWKFKNRSFVSATPIRPTSKEFTKQGFKFVIIDPDFEYKQPIEIFSTYNVLATVKDILIPVLKDKDNIQDHHCYFINSVDMIHCIIKDLNIKEISNIYCSVDAAKKLKELQYVNVYSNLNDLNKFNFFTSRFFSAVDIEVDFKPHITIVTDVKFASHSMVIPQTESIQIAGRFRNGVKSITHITNTDNTIEIKTVGEVISEIRDGKKAYDKLLTLYNTFKKDAYKTIFKEALERVEFAKLLTPDGELNWFKYENVLMDQLIKNAYHDSERLLGAYRDAGFFNLKHLDFKNHRFDDNKYFRRAGITKNALRREIVAELDTIDLSEIDENIFGIAQLEKEDPLIVKAYFELGKEFIEKIKYKEKDLWIALVKKAVERGESNHPILDAVLNIFNVDWEYTEDEIRTALQKIYDEFEMEIKAKATDLEEYFELSARKTVRKNGSESKGYKIIKAKFTKRKLGQN